jgi:hypothetical protein
MPDHTHQHGPDCGPTAIRHDGHVDYIHDGHLHHMHGDRVDEHVIAVSATNPAQCTPQVHCSHTHGPNCGHEAIPQGSNFSDFKIVLPADLIAGSVTDFQ